MQCKKQQGWEEVFRHYMGPPTAKGHRHSWRGKMLAIQMVYEKALGARSQPNESWIAWSPSPPLNSWPEWQLRWHIVTNLSNLNYPVTLRNFHLTQKQSHSGIHWWVRRLSLQHPRTFKNKIIIKKIQSVLWTVPICLGLQLIYSSVICSPPPPSQRNHTSTKRWPETTKQFSHSTWKGRIIEQVGNSSIKWLDVGGSTPLNLKISGEIMWLWSQCGESATIVHSFLAPSACGTPFQKHLNQPPLSKRSNPQFLTSPSHPPTVKCNGIRFIKNVLHYALKIPATPHPPLEH